MVTRSLTPGASSPIYVQTPVAGEIVLMNAPYTITWVGFTAPYVSGSRLFSRKGRAIARLMPEFNYFVRDCEHARPAGAKHGELCLERPNR
jgi:hypothetical protein